MRRTGGSCCAQASLAARVLNPPRASFTIGEACRAVATPSGRIRRLVRPERIPRARRHHCLPAHRFDPSNPQEVTVKFPPRFVGLVSKVAAVHIRRAAVFATLLTLAGWPLNGWARAADAPRLLPAKGDKIAIIGNTLADRMQHFGYFETLLQRRFPRHELVVRNLGFSGDELTLRLRSAGFGSPDDHLKAVEADVILAFFGYNESFAGATGLDEVQAGPRRVHQAHARPEVQRQERAAAGAVFADRARRPARPQSARRQGEQRAAQALHGRHGRGGRRRTACRSSICSRRR